MSDIFTSSKSSKYASAIILNATPFKIAIFYWFLSEKFIKMGIKPIKIVDRIVN